VARITASSCEWTPSFARVNGPDCLHVVAASVEADAELSGDAPRVVTQAEHQQDLQLARRELPMPPGPVALTDG
jgi:hypothetical protein